MAALIHTQIGVGGPVSRFTAFRISYSSSLIANSTETRWTSLSFEYVKEGDYTLLQVTQSLRNLVLEFGVHL